MQRVDTDRPAFLTGALRRFRWAIAVIAAPVAVAAVVVAWQATRSGGPLAGWERLPDSPLSARSAVVGVWTGAELILVGGSVYTCNDGGDCGGPIEPYLADGVALDPHTRNWRTIAPAPIAFAEASTAVIGDEIYFFLAIPHSTQGQLLRYSVGEDDWDVIAPPPVDRHAKLQAAGPQLVAYDDEAFVFDPAGERWDPLPLVTASTSASSGPTMVSADGGLYLFSTGGGSMPERPPLVRVARLDPASGAWTALPESGIRGNGPWFVDGGLIVNPVVDHSPGAVARWPDIPYGGIFDTANETWLPLPPRPEGSNLTQFEGRTAGVLGSNGDDALYLPPNSWPVQGLVLDLDSGEWIEMVPLDDPAYHTERNVFTAGRNMVVFGGARRLSLASLERGEPLGDAWIWRPGR